MSQSISVEQSTVSSTKTVAAHSRHNRSRAIGIALGSLAALFYIVTIVKFVVMLGAQP